MSRKLVARSLAFILVVATGSVHVRTASAACEPVSLPGPPAISGFTCSDEASYLAKLAELGYGSFREGFENDAIWGAARSPDTQASVISQGVRWAPNNTVSAVTTGARSHTGSWGFYESPHGDSTGSPTSPLRDGFIGAWTGAGSLLGVGGWLSSNTGGAQVRFVLDGVEVSFPNPGVTGPFTFLGVIDTTGFTAFEVYESQGVVEDQEFIFADDFHIATRSTPTPEPSRVVTVPVIAHLAGVGGTPWRSDVVVSNPGPDTVDLNLSYQPDNLAPLTATATVGGYSTLLFGDMVVGVFGAGDGRGPLRVEPQDAAASLPVLVARTYAEAPSGNLGSGLPAIRDTSAEPVIMPGLFHDAAYRSNIAVTASTDGGVWASFDLFRGGDGVVAEGVQRYVNAGAQDQWSVAQLFPGLARAGVPMTVRTALATPGVAYASLVDNASTDSAVYMGATAATSWIVPVVAHLPGREATFWRSDVAVWNASASALTLQLEFLPEDTDNSAGGIAAPEVTLGPYETLVFEDVVARQFGLNNSKGSLAVGASAPVVVTSRVFTAGPNNGTSGNGVRSVSASTLTPGAVVLPGVRTLAGFRTNIGVVTGDLGATFELLLFGGDGILLGSKYLAVPARSLRQLSIRQLFGSAETQVDPVGAVRITGDVAFAAYMTIIDGTSQDPVFVMPD